MSAVLTQTSVNALNSLVKVYPLEYYKTLVLNADYSVLRVMPLSVLSWTDAVHGIFKDRYEALHVYPGVVVRSQHLTMDLPSVVIIKQYQHVDHQISFSPSHVMLRDDYTCMYCDHKFKGVELTYDHVVPKSAGGRTDWDNIVSSCHKCNASKGNRSMKDWKSPMGLHRPKVIPRKPTYWELAKRVRKTELIIPDQSGWMDYLDWEGKVYARNSEGKLYQLQGPDDPISGTELMGF